MKGRINKKEEKVEKGKKIFNIKGGKVKTENKVHIH